MTYADTCTDEPTSLAELADQHGTDKGSHQGFMPHYEKYLPSRFANITMVELGVQHGNSIAMWEEWFKYAKVIGVDIDLSQVEEQQFTTRVQLLQGSQDDPHLANAICAYRHPAIIIDDASHVSDLTIRTFENWWPNLKPGGLYVVEDTHCSYDTEHYGYDSARQPNWPPEYNVPTTMEFLKRLADDANWGIHGYERFIPLYKDIAFVHFYPGICFIGKKGDDQ